MACEDARKLKGKTEWFVMNECLISVKFNILTIYDQFICVVKIMILFDLWKKGIFVLRNINRGKKSYSLQYSENLFLWTKCKGVVCFLNVQKL